MRYPLLSQAATHNTSWAALPTGACAVIFTLLFTLLTVSPVLADDTLDARVRELSTQARAAHHASDFELVERLRLERLSVIEEHAARDPESASLWIRAFKALEQVDGVTSTTDNAKPGLVNELKYKQAATLLRNVWAEFGAANTEPAFGEIAVRLFDLVQQAKAVYPEAMNPNSVDFVASSEELQNALRLAIEKDPCCIHAIPYLQYLNVPDPPAAEAFMRAEVRPLLSERQKQLVGIGHPVIFPASDSPQNAFASEPGAVASSVAANAERDDATLLPWHAAVEHVKAHNLQMILDELQYTSFLTPEVITSDYVLPGKIISGRDAAGNPFRLLYGRFLYCRVVDDNALTRSAVLYLDGQAKWHHRYLDLLWHHPTASESENPSVRSMQQFVDRLAVRSTWTLGDATFSLFACPLEELEFLLRSSIKQFCVTDSNKFPLLRYKNGRNDPDALIKLISLPRNLEAIFTSPEVFDQLSKVRQNVTSLAHPLASLLQGSGLNPLLLVSESEKSSNRVSPRFLRDSDGRNYLRLDTGQKLYFNITADIHDATCSVDFGGVEVCMPLHPFAIPKTMVTATGIGAAYLSLFKDSGYDEDAAVHEIQRCLVEPAYRPKKVEIVLRKAMTLQSKTGTRSASNSVPAADTLLSQMLRERGWEGEPQIAAGMNRIFFQYGFRSLRDMRGNWIYPRRISTALGEQRTTTNATNPSQKQQLASYPFEFRTPDGKSRIPQEQIYSWQDYLGIKRNKYTEHLRKLLIFHPCFPTIEVVQNEVLQGIVHPDDRGPDYLAHVGSQQGGQNDALQQESGKWDLGKQRLKAPVALWQVHGDEDQRLTMATILDAYVDTVLDAAKNGVLIKFYKQALDLVEDFERSSTEPQTRAKYKQIREALLNGWRNERKTYTESFSPLIALQLESARFAAQQRLFHRAIVFYNDLLVQLYPDASPGSERGLFLEVASTENARQFISSLETLIDGQRLLYTVQMELAGVLRSAGLHDSAYAVWKQISDDEEFFLEPALRNAREYVESYGIRFGERFDKVVEQLRDTARLAREAIARFDLEPEWTLGLEPADEARRDWERGYAKLDRLLTLQKEGVAVDNQERLIEDALTDINSIRNPGLANWLTLKKLLLQQRRHGLLFKTDLTIHPVRAFPTTYATDSASGEGFTQPEQEAMGAVDRCDAESLVQWAQRFEAGQPDTPMASDSAFLLAWYWHDSGDLPKSRSALTHLVRVLRIRVDTSRRAREDKAALVHERNYLSAVLASASLIQTLPGLSGVRADFSGLFTAQLVDWERRWFAAGLYGPHASRTRLTLEATSHDVGYALDRINSDWRQNRLFFKDYTFEFGPIPDYVAHMSLTSPELFRKLEENTNVAKEGEKAVENKKWVMDPQKSRAFFENLPIKPEIDTKIVLGAD